MVLLCLGISLPILLFVGTVVWQFASSEQARLRDETLDAARSIALSVDRELAGLRSASNVLSLSAYLRADDFASFHRQVSELLEIEGITSVLRAPDGQQLVNPHTPYGEPLPVNNLSVDQQVLATKQPGVSDLFWGAVTRKTFFSIVTPILRDGEVRYLLSMSLPTERVREVIAEQRAPDTWTIAVVDRSGSILARSHQHEEFVGKPTTPDLQANTQGREGTWNGFTADGREVFAAYARSQLSDWRVAVGVQESVLAAPLARSMWFLAALAAGLLSLSALLAWLVGRRITAPVQALSSQAAALGQGETVVPIVTPVREIADVGAALAGAATVLHAREQALKRETRALAIVNETGAAVAAERDLEHIVQLVTDAGRELTGAEFGAFFYNVLNDRGERFMLYALSGAEREAFAKFPMVRSTAVFQPTFEGEGVVRSDDILADPRYGKNAPYTGMPDGHLPVRSYLAVPVVSRSGEVLGGILYGHGKPGRFKSEHETLLSGVAGHAATAIDNARLFQANEQELAERRRAEAALQELNATLETRVAEALAERAQAEEALRQSQKMEAVGQLTGGIAHDFNNLLAGIVGSLDLMQSRIAQGRTAGLDRYVGAAMTSAQRAAALTHRLLAFSRRQPLDPKPIEANRLVAGMEDLLRRTLGPSISLEMVMAGGLWRTLCDPVQLESALLNLCINARDAMPDGGRLTIETANAHLDDTYAAAQRDVTPGQYVAICVTDTGVGMSPEVISRVFEPFFTTKPIGQGTGLGLSMVYGFAKQSEGHVRIYSEEGKGTTVKLYLPRHRGNEEADEAETQAAGVPRAEAGETVLVVEDEPVVRGVIIEVLSELGYRALEAADGPSGLKLLQSRSRIDLLITDVGLPGINGRQLADQARERRPDLKVLFVTGYAENATLANGFLEPGMAMLTKPFAVDALMRKVSQLLDEKASGSSQ
jgi:signal transduction histidine kinase/ActR/RegA family two-component response regulator